MPAKQLLQLQQNALAEIPVVQTAKGFILRIVRSCYVFETQYKLNVLAILLKDNRICTKTVCGDQSLSE